MRWEGKEGRRERRADRMRGKAGEENDVERNVGRKDGG